MLSHLTLFDEKDNPRYQFTMYDYPNFILFNMPDEISTRVGLKRLAFMSGIVCEFNEFTGFVEYKITNKTQFDYFINITTKELGKVFDTELRAEYNQEELAECLWLIEKNKQKEKVK